LECFRIEAGGKEIPDDIMKNAFALAQKEIAKIVQGLADGFPSESNENERSQGESVITVESLRRLVHDVTVNVDENGDVDENDIDGKSDDLPEETKELTPTLIRHNANGPVRPGVYAVPPELQAAVDAKGLTGGLELYQTKGGLNRKERGQREGRFRGELMDWLKRQEELSSHGSLLINMAVEATMAKAFKQSVLAGSRADGREAMELRTLKASVDVLPAVHGSAFFERGDTHVLCTTTLGSRDDTKLIRPSNGGPETEANFFLHYEFPPYAVGDVGNSSQLNRRMIGHGNLAEKALKPVLPAFEDFPYSIRVFSECTSSSGSSSMASACGASLALIDAGVPITSLVAGVSIGLITEQEQILTPSGPNDMVDAKYIILTDILGMEDHYGDMDFKIAGTENGITAMQLDVKNPLGIPLSIIQESLDHARRGRLQILTTLTAATANKFPLKLKATAPRASIIRCDSERKINLLGPGGEMLRYIEKQFDCKINVREEGEAYVFGHDIDKVKEACELVRDLVAEIKIDDVYMAEVSEVKDFGVLVKIARCQEALLHYSELSHDATITCRPVREFMQVGQEVQVKVLKVDTATGQIKVSRKALLDATIVDDLKCTPKAVTLSPRAEVPVFPVNPPRKWNRNFFRKFVATPSDIEKALFNQSPKSDDSTMAPLSSASSSAVNNEPLSQTTPSQSNFPQCTTLQSKPSLEDQLASNSIRSEGSQNSKPKLWSRPAPKLVTPVQSKPSNLKIKDKRDKKHETKTKKTSKKVPGVAAAVHIVAEDIKDVAAAVHIAAEDIKDVAAAVHIAAEDIKDVAAAVHVVAEDVKDGSWDISAVKPMDYSLRLLDNDNYDDIISATSKKSVVTSVSVIQFYGENVTSGEGEGNFKVTHPVAASAGNVLELKMAEITFDNASDGAQVTAKAIEESVTKAKNIADAEKTT
jgi:polyribonucleotide nucleotidyltransferase